MAKELAGRIETSDDFELLAPVPVNLVCFRYHPKGVDEPSVLDSLNESLVATLNDTGKIFLTHTRLNGTFTVRLVTGQTQVTSHDVTKAWELIQATARNLRK